MPVPWLSFVVVGVALVCSMIRMREQSRRKSEQNFVLEIALPPLATLRLHLVALAAVIWTLLTLAIDKPIGALVGAGSAGVAAVVCTGLALGAVGMPVVALGAALCQLLWLPPDSVVTVVWALPIIVGYLLRLVHLGPQYWMGYSGLLLLIDKQGTVIRASTPAEWFWRGLQAATAAGLVVAVALLPVQGLGTADVAARWGGALVVAAELAWGARNLRAVANRRFRLLFRICAVLGAVTSFAVAASPAGAWVATRWAGVPLLTGLVGGVLLAGVATGLWMTLEVVKSRDAMSGLPRWAQLLGPLRMPFHGGLAAVSLALLHPLPGLAMAAAVLAATEAAGLLAGRNRHFWDHQRVRSAASFLWFDNDRERLLGGWLHDACLRRPAHPDLSLLRTLGGLATLSVQGWTIPGQAPTMGGAPQLKQPMAGMAALRWTDFAAQALGLVEAEVVPRCPPEHLAALERSVAETRAELSCDRAIVLHLAGEAAAALDQWRDAALRYRRIGAPAHELVARLVMVYLLALPLARPADAHREHARLRRPGHLPSAIRKLALVADSAAALSGGDQDTARPPAPAAHAEDGWRAMRAALAADAGLPAPDRRQCLALAVLMSQAEASLGERGGDDR